jgi:2-oxoglutarate dehydrogenase E2 component (dihydrolipoamide succinyltransferase)
MEIKIPSPGESITQVVIAAWLVKNNELVVKDAEIAEVESDKATMALYAPVTGRITLLVDEGSTVNVGDVVATMEAGSEIPETKTADIPVKPESVTTPPEQKHIHISPLAKKIIAENNIDTGKFQNVTPGQRITKKDVLSPAKEIKKEEPGRETERKKMSPLRLKIAERLVSVKNETAMLTTFNEVNMKKISEFKALYGQRFIEKFGAAPGYTAIFAKAAALALQGFQAVNAMIDGEDIVYHKYVDINIAVSSPKGLITPLVRNADKLSVHEIDAQIKGFASRAAANRITLDDLAAGTFTITNGGIFGSMMSTPIINPPQTAILGMHKVTDRAMVVNGVIEILPMMYIALSYDHRLIDGKESVGFVVKMKEILEDPIEKLFGGESNINELLR